MKKIGVLLVLLIMAIAILFSGCIQKTESASETTPELTPEVSLPEVKEGLQGILVIPPKAKEKFEIIHQVESEFSVEDTTTPRIRIAIKNIGTETFESSSGYFDNFYLEVSSLDASGNILGDVSRRYKIGEISIEPKEILPVVLTIEEWEEGWINLFRSDEVKFYKIEIKYVPPLPTVTGKYIDTPDLKEKLESSIVYGEWEEEHGIEYRVSLKIKNIGNQSIYTNDLKIYCVLKDALGEIIKQTRSIPERGRLEPGEDTTERIDCSVGTTNEVYKVKNYEVWMEEITAGPLSNLDGTVELLPKDSWGYSARSLYTISVKVTNLKTEDKNVSLYLEIFRSDTDDLSEWKKITLLPGETKTVLFEFKPMSRTYKGSYFLGGYTGNYEVTIKAYDYESGRAELLGKLRKSIPSFTGEVPEGSYGM